MKMNSKIKSVQELKKISDKLRSQSKKIVTTNGVFDILHVGHIRYLKQAKSLGDILIVGINSDSSVKKIKGPKRPINSENERAEVLSALQFVDYILIFSEDNPVSWLKEIKPHYHAKGGDYSIDRIIERSVVESNHGKIVLLSLAEGKSTSNIIERIKSENT